MERVGTCQIDVETVRVPNVGVATDRRCGRVVAPGGGGVHVASGRGEDCRGVQRRRGGGGEREDERQRGGGMDAVDGGGGFHGHSGWFANTMRKIIPAVRGACHVVSSLIFAGWVGMQAHSDT